MSTAYVSRLNPDPTCEDNHEHGSDHTHTSDLEAALPNVSAPPENHKHITDERTPLTLPHSCSYAYGHNPYESRIAHAFHHGFSHKVSGTLSHDDEADRQSKAADLDPAASNTTIAAGNAEELEDQVLEEAVEEEEHKDIPKTGKRQVVGILVSSLFLTRLTTNQSSGTATGNHDPLVCHRTHSLHHLWLGIQ